MRTPWSFPERSSGRAFELLVLVFSTILVAVPATVRASIIHVPGGQPTIQAGINAAQTPDTVLVAPGTYSGPGNINLDFLGKNIAVVSQGGPMVTVIDPQFAGRGFHLYSTCLPRRGSKASPSGTGAPRAEAVGS
jgi:hypothetical protein